MTSRAYANERDRLEMAAGRSPHRPPPTLLPGQERRLLRRQHGEGIEEAIERASAHGWWLRVIDQQPASSAAWWIWTANKEPP